MTAKSKSAKHYKSNPESRRKKAAYDKKFNSKPSQRKKRAELNRERRKRGIYGKGGGDLHHAENGKFVLEPASKNRGRKENSRLKRSKRAK